MRKLNGTKSGVETEEHNKIGMFLTLLGCLVEKKMMTTLRGEGVKFLPSFRKQDAKLNKINSFL